MFVPVNTYCYIHASLLFFLGCPFFLFQIVWVGKIYKHAKIIIYVCSTVCGGGAGGDIDLVNMWGSWGGGGNIGGRIWVRVGTEESMQDLALHHKEYTFAATNCTFLNTSKKQKL